MSLRKFILILFLGCLFTSPVYAYLDGGTGSLIVQSLFAGVAGFLAILKLYWHNFKNLINRLRGKPPIETVSLLEDEDNQEK